MPNEEIQAIPTQGDHPPWNIPIWYVDGIASISPTNYTVKVYYYRTDPHVTANGPSLNQLVGQLVLPQSAFIYQALFMQKALEQFVTQGTFTKEQVASVKALVDKANA